MFVTYQMKKNFETASNETLLRNLFASITINASVVNKKNPSDILRQTPRQTSHY